MARKKKTETIEEPKVETIEEPKVDLPKVTKEPCKLSEVVIPRTLRRLQVNYTDKTNTASRVDSRCIYKGIQL